jgi:hypothetical protein
VSEALKPRRGLFRFRLRTLLILVAVCGGWLGWEGRWIRQRHEFLQLHPPAGRGLPYLHGSADDRRLVAESLTFPFRQAVSIYARAVLWLFREPEVRDLPLTFAYLDTPLLSSPERLQLADPEIQTAQRLFPEAALTVTLISKAPPRHPFG